MIAVKENFNGGWDMIHGRNLQIMLSRPLSLRIIRVLVAQADDKELVRHRKSDVGHDFHVRQA